jgi:hypothetical protein
MESRDWANLTSTLIDGGLRSAWREAFIPGFGDRKLDRKWTGHKDCESQKRQPVMVGVA